MTESSAYIVLSTAFHLNLNFLFLKSAQPLKPETHRGGRDDAVHLWTAASCSSRNTMALNKKCFDLDIEIECILKLSTRPNKALVDLSAHLSLRVARVSSLFISSPVSSFFFYVTFSLPLTSAVSRLLARLSLVSLTCHPRGV